MTGAERAERDSHVRAELTDPANRGKPAKELARLLGVPVAVVRRIRRAGMEAKLVQCRDGRVMNVAALGRTNKDRFPFATITFRLPRDLVEQMRRHPDFDWTSYVASGIRAKLTKFGVAPAAETKP